MVFFQSLLLGGYAYAHFLMQLRNRVIPVAVHLVLLVIALLTLPLSISSGWGDPPNSGYAIWLLGLFAVSIGLPFFALAANNPLLQAWFVRTGHPSGPDPYFLYASSNIGSFLALLSYPVLLEPMFTLRTQNLIWTGGYGLLIVLIAACGLLLLRSPANAAELNMPAEDADAPAPSWTARARWIFLAAVPSGLLIAVTAIKRPEGTAARKIQRARTIHGGGGASASSVRGSRAAMTGDRSSSTPQAAIRTISRP
jgi:hypothetical protein